jgi:hypothetical protein
VQKCPQIFHIILTLLAVLLAKKVCWKEWAWVGGRVGCDDMAAGMEWGMVKQSGKGYSMEREGGGKIYFLNHKR